ncbi:hypothetical protein OH720_02555 [Pseudomonas sp. WJP1]|uniref:hypothetical protein n=1 Tax=Pseudomonas sp. WJP1 TaxID=2986947 RepID=UPI00234915E9|nr:hypothetical protein [Pseudomonas sp. WJP1]WCM51919.1 hypothetical protein OH720_02555 [Pseudomonas sp. WJP1]
MNEKARWSVELQRAFSLAKAFVDADGPFAGKPRSYEYSVVLVGAWLAREER